MLNTIINIIVLLLSLSVLICLHELGHLLVAKKFNVYCAEYSIGMGPLLFKVKKPNQETQFSIRAIPIGGFVSMAGEGSGEIDEMKEVPKERFLTSIKRWKRALIMVAGVFVNFVLSLILFFGSGLASPILDESKQSFKVMDSTSKVTYLASEAGLTSNDVITNFKYVFNIGSSEKVSSKEIASGRDLYKAYYMSGLDEKEYAPTSTNDKLTVYLTTIDSRTISFTISAVEQTVKNAFGPDVVYYAWNLNEAGLDFNTRHRNFKEAMNRASDEFVTSLTSFKVLFQPGGWKNLGGVISVYQVSSYATGVGFYYYLYVWGYISLNLAIVNLLPFPGLDGWHLVVCAFEGITRKDMPTKVREVMSVIGTVLLIGLMIFVTVLDILRL